MNESERTSQGMSLTRRRLLSGAAATGAAALTSLAPNVGRALAATESSGHRPSLRDIKHVVLLMQ